VALKPDPKQPETASSGSGFRPRTRVEFLLRVDGREIVVNLPRLVVGRSSSCDVQLDSASVSRQHAVISVTEPGLCIEDLGSRNGVFVNGVLIGRRFVLQPGDRVRVGDHEIEVARLPGTEPESAEIEVVIDVEWEDLSTRRIDPLEVLGGIVDHALARGDHEEAEALLGGHLRVLLRETGSGAPLPGPSFLAASGYALRLAESSGRGLWLDYLFELHLNCRRLMPATLVSELFRIASVVRYQDRQVLRRYLELLTQDGARMGPDATVVLERLRRYGRL
jgi:pSer/pThr/pTyr-binding forkhead associated (FHA) protein